MKHTALIQTTERASGAHIAAPFLLSAVRKTAAACCAGDARLRAMLADDPLFREGYPLLKAGV